MEKNCYDMDRNNIRKIKSENSTDNSDKPLGSKKRKLSKIKSNGNGLSKPFINIPIQHNNNNLDLNSNHSGDDSEIFPLNENWEIEELQESMSKYIVSSLSDSSSAPCASDAALQNKDKLLDLNDIKQVQHDVCIRTSNKVCNGKNTSKVEDSNGLSLEERQKNNTYSANNMTNSESIDCNASLSSETDNIICDNLCKNCFKYQEGVNNEGMQSDLTSTDFSRFKESSVCENLFSPDVWKSIDNGNLEYLSKNMDSTMDDQGLQCNSKKRSSTHLSSSKKRNKQDIDETSPTTEHKRMRNERDVNTDVESQDNVLTINQPETNSTSTLNSDCYVALDCEMVGTGPKGSRSVLGRCSIVDFNGTVLYDKFVRSPEPITDFRTRWSGIRPRDMKTAEPTVKAIQEIHQCLKNKIIIGHSVRNDFKVIYFHPHRLLVRDTASCAILSRKANLNKSRQGNGLKSLTKNILGKEIQTGKKGHNSVEDATATLELFKIVRKEWETELFSTWKREGLDVEKFIEDFNNKRDVIDSKGHVITDFNNKYVVSESKVHELIAKDSQVVKVCHSNHGDLDYNFNIDFLSDKYWPSSI